MANPLTPLSRGLFEEAAHSFENQMLKDAQHWNSAAITHQEMATQHHSILHDDDISKDAWDHHSRMRDAHGRVADAFRGLAHACVGHNYN
jgi:hypothetical protein